MSNLNDLATLSESFTEMLTVGHSEVVLESGVKVLLSFDEFNKESTAMLYGRKSKELYLEVTMQTDGWN